MIWGAIDTHEEVKTGELSPNPLDTVSAAYDQAKLAHQGFNYGNQMVLRNVTAPYNKQDGWSLTFVEGYYQDAHSQRIKTFAHVRSTTGQIDADISLRANHRRAARTCRNELASISPVSRSFIPFGSSTSTFPAACAANCGSTGTDIGAGNASVSGASDTGAKPVSAPVRNCLRHV